MERKGQNEREEAQPNGAIGGGATAIHSSGGKTGWRNGQNSAEAL